MMRRALLSAWICLLGVLGVLAVYLLFFHRLADRDLWSSHEARAGMDAQTVLDDGAWGLPRLYSGEPELQKPPLYYWLVASIALLRGGAVDAWGVRLPAAGAAVMCVLGLAAFGWARGRLVAGLAAGVVLATAMHFTWLARIGRIDMPLTLTVGAAVGMLFLARRPGAQHRMLLLVVAYLAVAAGVLLKGPIGAVLPAAVVAAHLLVEGELPPPWRARAWLRLVHEFGLWWGLPLVLALSLPWFVWADAVTHGELFRVFILRHNIERGLGDGDLKVHPWWFYGPQFASDFLPWTVLLPVAAFVCWRRGYWRADPEARLGLAWLLAATLVLSCAAFKRGDYLLPAYPGAALFLGCIFSNEERRWREARPRAVWVGLHLAPCLLAAGMTVGWLARAERGLPAEEPFRDYTRFAAAVRRQAPRPEEVVFFRTEAHALAFHVGRPMTVLVEWRDLEARLAGSGTQYVVMPPDSAAEAHESLPDVRFEEVLRNTDLSEGLGHERPLVLMKMTTEN
jgi:4-amino-4-deoxy-L-arabinose transferase-like glycosyltransferase